MKKVLLTLLTTFMLFTAIGVNVSADENPTVKQYDGYIAFGDSMARGYTGKNYEIANNFELRNVDGSYTYLVSKAIDCESPKRFNNVDDEGKKDERPIKYFPVCFMGQTVSATLDLMNVNDGYYDGLFDHMIMSTSYLQATNRFGETKPNIGATNYQGSIKNILG